MHMWIPESGETPLLSSKDALTTGTPNQFLWTNAHLDTSQMNTPHPAKML